MSTTTPVPPAVVAALKEKALKKAREMAGEISPEMAVEEEKSAEPAKPIEWPSVLKHNVHTKMYSELFPEYWEHTTFNKDANPDFAIPFYDKHEFPEWMKAYIPVESDYRGNPQLVYDAALAFSCGSVTHVVGWPGTGKSNGLPVLLAVRLGLPLLRLGLNKKGMMLEDLIGREAIKHGHHGMETGHRDGTLIPWVDQPCIILADEFSRANAEISNGLMSFMERGGSLIVENRESPVIKRHEHCWIIASDNVKGLGDGVGKFVGTDMVDCAILDRFEITLEVDYLPEAEQLALVHQWYPTFPEKEAKKIVKFGMLIQQAYKKDTLPLSFSPRSLKEVCRYACLHHDVGTAVRKVVLSKYAEEADIQCVKEQFRTAFGKAL